MYNCWIKSKKSIQKALSFAIPIACFIFVSWQSVKCIAKFMDSPHGTKASLQNIAATHTFPAITICKHAGKAYDPYNSNQLKNCKLR